jgi:hypothetical protein
MKVACCGEKNILVQEYVVKSKTSALWWATFEVERRVAPRDCSHIGRNYDSLVGQRKTKAKRGRRRLKGPEVVAN